MTLVRTRRHEFSTQTKREAYARSGGFCEAEGVVYGLQPGERCNNPLAGTRKEYDHYPLPAGDDDSDVLENCVVCCKHCHGRKTATYDIPMQAKGKRLADADKGIRPRVSRPIPGSKASGIKIKFDGTVERRQPHSNPDTPTTGDA